MGRESICNRSDEGFLKEVPSSMTVDNAAGFDKSDRTADERVNRSIDESVDRSTESLLISLSCQGLGYVLSC
jgi:hypothetical protein